MSGRVEIINNRDQCFVAGKWVKVNDQRFRRAVQATRTIEELAPQGGDMAPDKVPVQFVGKVGDGVVDQGNQPADHLQRPAMKTRPFAIRTLFVVTTGY